MLGPDLLVAKLRPGRGGPPPSRAVARRTPRSARRCSTSGRVAGVGNVYKSEVLFMEKVDPFAPGEVARQRDARPDPHDRARAAPGERAIRFARRPLDHGRPQDRRKLAPSRLWVYDRAGRPCHRCGTLIASDSQGTELPRSPTGAQRRVPGARGREGRAIAAKARRAAEARRRRPALARRVRIIAPMCEQYVAVAAAPSGSPSCGPSPSGSSGTARRLRLGRDVARRPTASSDPTVTSGRSATTRARAGRPSETRGAARPPAPALEVLDDRHARHAAVRRPGGPVFVQPQRRSRHTRRFRARVPRTRAASTARPTPRSPHAGSRTLGGRRTRPTAACEQLHDTSAATRTSRS